MSGVQTTTYAWTDPDGDDQSLEVEFTISGSYDEGYSVEVHNINGIEDYAKPLDFSIEDQTDLEGWLLDRFLPEDDA